MELKMKRRKKSTNQVPRLQAHLQAAKRKKSQNQKRRNQRKRNPKKKMKWKTMVEMMVMTLMGKRVVTTVKMKIRFLQRVHTFICARQKNIGDNYKAFFS